MKVKKAVLAGAGLTATVVAGTLFAFSATTLTKLSRMQDREYIETMQAINRDIQTPWFIGSFIGAAVLLPLAAYLYRKSGSSTKFRLLCAASLLYVIGTVGITSGINVPLNDKLATVAVDSASPHELATTRDAYEGTWNSWHTVRTVTSVAAVATLLGAIIIQSTKNK